MALTYDAISLLSHPLLPSRMALISFRDRRCFPLTRFGAHLFPPMVAMRTSFRLVRWQTCTFTLSVIFGSGNWDVPFQRSVVAVAASPSWGVSGRSVRDSSGPCMQIHCTGNSFLSILCISRGSQHDGTSLPIWLSTPSASPFSLLTPFKYVKGGN